MNGNTDCIAVSNIGEITTYVNNLIAIPTIIDNTIIQNIKAVSYTHLTLPTILLV